MQKKHQDKIMIIDFGSQYTQLIARRVREAGVYCEIFHHETDPEKIKNFQAKAIILSGGPESVTQNQAPVIPDIIFKLSFSLLAAYIKLMF